MTRCWMRKTNLSKSSLVFGVLMNRSRGAEICRSARWTLSPLKCNHSCCGPMRSVPPRGSGWVLVPVTHAEVQGGQYQFAHLFSYFSYPFTTVSGDLVIASRTHPLPRGGTDL